VTGTVVLAWGNPGRGDDALGPLLVERLRPRFVADVDYVTDYQLQVEHALDVAGRGLALFVDASVAAPPPFAFESLAASPDNSFSTHALSPAAVLHTVARVLGSPPPPAFLLALRGEQFALGAPLSAAAGRHLDAAEAFAAGLLARPDPRHWERRLGAAGSYPEGGREG
jgi:hydrogenase maturation protease